MFRFVTMLLAKLVCSIYEETECLHFPARPEESPALAMIAVEPERNKN
jgi:hypothetical protein